MYFVDTDGWLWYGVIREYYIPRLSGYAQFEIDVPENVHIRVR